MNCFSDILIVDYYPNLKEKSIVITFIKLCSSYINFIIGIALVDIP
jgi:hypothetical protein